MVKFYVGWPKSQSTQKTVIIILVLYKVRPFCSSDISQHFELCTENEGCSFRQFLKIQ